MFSKIKQTKEKLKRVLITGATGGIASKLVQKYLNQGHQVIGVSLSISKIIHPNYQHFQVDLTNSKSIENWYQDIKNLQFHEILHLAGKMIRGDIEQSSEEEFDLLLSTNLKSIWLIQKYLLKNFSPNCRILIVSSRHGEEPKIDPAIYSLSKNAVWCLAEILQKTHPHWKVKVAFPGSVDTKLSWTGVSELEAEKKKKVMISTEEMSEKLWELMHSNFRYLAYNQENNSYFTCNMIGPMVN